MTNRLAKNDRWITDAEFNALVERDEAMPVKRFTLSNGEDVGICPKCEGAVIGKEYSFCPRCGQRVDAEIFAL